MYVGVERRRDDGGGNARPFGNFFLVLAPESKNERMKDYVYDHLEEADDLYEHPLLFTSTSSIKENRCGVAMLSKA